MTEGERGKVRGEEQGRSAQQKLPLSEHTPPLENTVKMRDLAFEALVRRRYPPRQLVQLSPLRHFLFPFRGPGEVAFFDSFVSHRHQNHQHHHGGHISSR